MELVKHSASDADVLWAARVSTAGEQSLEEIGKDPERSKGLINYLMRDRHGSPFEHNSMTFLVSAPIFVFREFHRHRVGWCLPGDSRIPVGTLKNTNNKKIKDIYSDWHEGVRDSMGRTRMLSSCRHLSTRTVNLETGLIEWTRMVDVFKSGVKPILKIETAAGKTLRCSPDHAILSRGEWVKAKDLTSGDLVSVQATVPVGESTGIPRRLREEIQFWTTRMKPEVVSAIDACHVCGGIFDFGDLEVDHVVPVSREIKLALDKDNLAPICAPCHETKSSREAWEVERRPSRLGIRDEKIISVMADGEEETYDISMPGPWHNFIADGIVVHNSYNEESGRYRELQPKFYVPGIERKLVQEGRPGKYVFVEGSAEQHKVVSEAMESAYRQSYAAYQEMLEAGVAREVARAVLPVGLFSSMYATCNARSLMHFLSLRTKSEQARVPSFPQREIEMVAEKMEAAWAELMPLTHAAFVANGRVAP
ncbi:FAD-dependent thymidylate synthase [Planomonospora sp. ID82291]|uniref:FAD-dependent thymidylate synthase n=1 Tax=Planomonospora sp. ID82291 TaxID=2738136 RepID=UPI0018C37C72|nr:FAD-dependent thymidylate synthase [Planomonospora sp. ID82291]